MPFTSVFDDVKTGPKTRKRVSFTSVFDDVKTEKARLPGVDFGGPSAATMRMSVKKRPLLPASAAAVQRELSPTRKTLEPVPWTAPGAISQPTPQSQAQVAVAALRPPSKAKPKSWTQTLIESNLPAHARAVGEAQYRAEAKKKGISGDPTLAAEMVGARAEGKNADELAMWREFLAPPEPDAPWLSKLGKELAQVGFYITPLGISLQVAGAVSEPVETAQGLYKQAGSIMPWNILESIREHPGMTLANLAMASGLGLRGVKALGKQKAFADIMRTAEASRKYYDQGRIDRVTGRPFRETMRQEPDYVAGYNMETSAAGAPLAPLRTTPKFPKPLAPRGIPGMPTAQKELRTAEAPEMPPPVVETPVAQGAITGLNPTKMERRTYAPEEVKVDPTIQWKTKGIVDKEAGVTGEYKNVKEYDTAQAGVLVVWERTNGETYVAHGHHRLDIAKRAERFVRDVPGESGMVSQEMPRLLEANVLKESEGWTKPLVRGYSALLNIRDGKGSPIDAVGVIRDLGKTDADLAKLRISPGSVMYRDVKGLLRLGDEALNTVRAGDVPESVAAGIGAYATTPEAQAVAIRQAITNDLSTYDQGARIAQRSQENMARRADTGQAGMFADAGEGWIDTSGIQVKIEDGITAIARRQHKEIGQGLDLTLVENEQINRSLREELSKAVGDNQAQIKAKLSAVYQYDGSVKDAIRQQAERIARNEIGIGEAVANVQALAVESAKRPLAEIVKTGVGQAGGLRKPDTSALESPDDFALVAGRGGKTTEPTAAQEPSGDLGLGETVSSGYPEGSIRYTAVDGTSRTITPDKLDSVIASTRSAVTQLESLPERTKAQNISLKRARTTLAYLEARAKPSAANIPSPKPAEGAAQAKAARKPATQGQLGVREGFVVSGKTLHVDPGKLELARAGLDELKKTIMDIERQARASTPSKRRQLEANARAANKDLARLENEYTQALVGEAAAKAKQVVKRMKQAEAFDEISKTIAEAEPTTLYDKLDALEKKLKSEMQLPKGPKAGQFDIGRASAIGAIKIAKGAVKFAGWSEEMVKDFGEAIRPYLNSIYKQSREYYERNLKASIKEAAFVKEALPPSVASVKNAVTDARRKALGLEPLAKRPRTPQEIRTQQANDLIDSGALKPDELVSEVNKQPRPLDETETDVLHEAFSRLERDLATARESNDVAQLRVLRQKYDDYSKAATLAGSEQSYAFSARKQAVDPYSLEDLLHKGRTNIPRFDAAIEAKVTTLHERLKSAEAKEASSRKRPLVRNPGDFLKPTWGDSNTVITREIREANLARLGELTARLHAGVDPEIVKALATEIGYHVEAGARFAYKTLYNHLKEYGATRDEIRAAYSQAMNQSRNARALEYQKRKILALEEGIRTKTGIETPPPIEYSKDWVKAHTETVKLQAALDRIVEPRKSLGAKLRDAALLLPNAVTGFLSSWDNSFIGRQGWKMLAKDPRAWGGMVKQSFRAMFSEGVAYMIDAEIRDHPGFPLARRSKVEMTELEANAPLSKAEEPAMYMRSLGRVIPGLPHLTRPFDRAFTIAGNYVRHDAFYRMNEHMGDKWTDVDYLNYGKDLNIWSGRGDLGRLARFQPEIGALLISGRKVAADLQFFLTPFRGTRATKVDNIKSIVRGVAALYAFGLLVNTRTKQHGWTVNLDPEDYKKDYLQLRKGNTRIDLTGGSAQVLRVFGRTAEIAYGRSRWGGDEAKGYGQPGVWDPTKRYLGYKVSPGVRALWSLWTKQDWKGDPTTDKQIALELVTPWNVSDMIEAWQTDGAGMGVTAGIAGFLGLSARSYQEKPKKKSGLGASNWLDIGIK